MQLFVGLTNVRLQSLSDYQVFLSMGPNMVFIPQNTDQRECWTIEMSDCRGCQILNHFRVQSTEMSVSQNTVRLERMLNCWGLNYT